MDDQFMYSAHMSRRTHRARADLLCTSTMDCWLVIDDRWRRIIRKEKLPVGTDLLRRFLVEMLAYHDNGWHLHQFTSDWAHFYASKDGTQHYFQITSLDPDLPRISTDLNFFKRP
jgi:hypothetical protein